MSFSIRTTEMAEQETRGCERRGELDIKKQFRNVGFLKEGEGGRVCPLRSGFPFIFQTQNVQ